MLLDLTRVARGRGSFFLLLILFEGIPRFKTRKSTGGKRKEFKENFPFLSRLLEMTINRNP